MQIYNFFEPETLNLKQYIMKDLFGKAILDYQTNNSPENLFTETSISDEDEMSVSYLFRAFSQMPKIEQEALEMCFGTILDVGCGAGSHSLYLENEMKLDLTSIDISTNAIKACQLRGLKNAKIANILELDANFQKFDTILLLMNGTGIFGKLSETSKYLQKLKSLLNENGQILIDSSDLIYMYDDEDLEEIKNSKQYYGEITFSVKYKKEKEIPFPWLYLDFKLLKSLSNANGLQCEKIIIGENFDYLAKLFI
jgi:2-polyprenyl-3-methyl-5-hydroxy-6-metoxy-1,4-benzoquinol methylase